VATPLAARRALSSPLRRLLTGLLFISPWLVGLCSFTIYPILASLYYSLTEYDVINPPRFVGLANYVDLLTADDNFFTVLYNTLYFVAFGVPSGIAITFLLAALLNNPMRLRPLFRTVFFLPAIVPAVASAMVWLWIYNPSYGLIASQMASLGLTAIPWLSSPGLAKISLIIVHVWAQGTAMLIFLAALQDVPRTLYDAAQVDGANALQRFRHVTIPMCTPAILFVMLTGMIGIFQNFTVPWLMTEGGPRLATEFYGIYLYRNAFAFFKMGYASALAWILFLIAVAVTVALFRSSARWVYYGGQTE
jgi:multiple sugar transport system permease protein